MLVYLGMSLFFFKERTCYADTPFQIFKLIHFGKFNFEAGRFSTFIVELLPLCFIKMDLSLKMVLLAFSLSYSLVYYLVFLLMVYVLNDKRSGLLLALTLMVCTRLSFFYMTTETIQGLAYSVLFFASYRSDRVKNVLIKIIVNALLIVLCLFAHPITFFTLLFTFIYTAIERRQWKPKTMLFSIALFFVLYFFKIKSIDTNSYEGSQFNIAELLNWRSYLVYSYNSTHFFSGHFLRMYSYMVLVALFGVFDVFRSDKWLASFCVLFYAAFGLVILINFKDGGAQVLMEKNFMPFAFLSAVPFLQSIRPHNMVPKTVVLTAVLLISVTGIVHSRSVITQWFEQEYALLGGEPKKIIDSKSLKVAGVTCNWAMPFETLMLSSLSGPANSKTVYLREHELGGSIDLTSPTLFLGPDFYQIWDTREFNKRYFNLPPTAYAQRATD